MDVGQETWEIMDFDGRKYIENIWNTYLIGGLEQF
jgi:hypothetical protein